MALIIQNSNLNYLRPVLLNKPFPLSVLLSSNSGRCQTIDALYRECHQKPFFPSHRFPHASILIASSWLLMMKAYYRFDDKVLLKILCHSQERGFSKSTTRLEVWGRGRQSSVSPALFGTLPPKSSLNLQILSIQILDLLRSLHGWREQSAGESPSPFDPPHP